MSSSSLPSPSAPQSLSASSLPSQPATATALSLEEERNEQSRSRSRFSRTKMKTTCSSTNSQAQTHSQAQTQTRAHSLGVVTIVSAIVLVSLAAITTLLFQKAHRQLDILTLAGKETDLQLQLQLVSVPEHEQALVPDLPQVQSDATNASTVHRSANSSIQNTHSQVDKRRKHKKKKRRAVSIRPSDGTGTASLPFDSGNTTSTSTTQNNVTYIRPTSLILHVGPTKTATTTIQLQLLQHSDIQQALQMDGMLHWTKFNFRIVRAWKQNCFETQDSKQNSRNDSTIFSCSPAYVRKIQEEFAPPWLPFATTNGDNEVLRFKNTTNITTIIKSCETYSTLPNNTLTRHLMQDLIRKQYWNDKVTILVVYRRFSNWLPSRYYQYRKYRMLHSNSRHYTDFSSKSGAWDQRTLGEFLMQEMVANEFRGDPGYTYQIYSEWFGTQNVRVVYMHDDHAKQQQLSQTPLLNQLDQGPNDNTKQIHERKDVLEKFMCNAVASPKACDLTRRLNSQSVIENLNTNEEFLFDEDLLVVHAYHQYGLLGGRASYSKSEYNNTQRFVRRHEARVILHTHMQEKRITMADLPQICLNKNELEVVWQRTWQTELMMARAMRRPSPDEMLLRQLFAVDQQRFCHVDAKRTMANDMWRKLLFPNCLYLLYRPCNITVG